jgi:hypothetical protein
MTDPSDDDEIVSYETAIVDGLPEVSGLREIPVRRGDLKRRALRQIERHVLDYLALGGTSADARSACDEAIVAWEKHTSST